MLTPAQISQYQNDGFLVFPQLLSSTKLKKYIEMVDALVEMGKSLIDPQPHWSLEFSEDRQPIPGMLHKVQGAFLVEPNLLPLAQEEPLLSYATTLLDQQLDVFGTKFFPKLPHGGTSVGWHQDNYYFGTSQEQIVSCAIYLEDTDRKNGCLRLIPKSHLPQAIRPHQRMLNGHGSFTEVDETLAVDLEIAAGTAVLFSPNLLHGTHDNRSQRSRYTVVWHYIPADFGIERFPKSGEGDRHVVSRGS